MLPAVAATLLIVATLLALALATRRDYRGAWALLILLTPIGMLAVNPLGAMLDTDLGRPIVPPLPLMVTASVLVVVIGPALLLLALTARSRLAPASRHPTRMQVVAQPAARPRSPHSPRHPVAGRLAPRNHRRTRPRPNLARVTAGTTVTDHACRHAPTAADDRR